MFASPLTGGELLSGEDRLQVRGRWLCRRCGGGLRLSGYREAADAENANKNRGESVSARIITSSFDDVEAGV